MKYNIKRGCIFQSILFGIPFILILPVKNKGDGVVFAYWQNLTKSAKRVKSYLSTVPNFLPAMTKRVVQWSKARINSSFLAAIMENRFHKLYFYFFKILRWGIDMAIFLFWCQNWGHFHELKLVKCDNSLLRSTIHYLHYNNWIK